MSAWPICSSGVLFANDKAMAVAQILASAQKQPLM
jgi:hypothetical protein